MKKVVLGAVIGVGVLFGLDYAKMSNEELIKQSGKFPAKEVLEYHAELDKRADKMTPDQARDFFLQVKEERIKNEEKMLVKDLRERNREIHAIMSSSKDRPYTNRHARGSYGGHHKSCAQRGHHRYDGHHGYESNRGNHSHGTHHHY